MRKIVKKTVSWQCAVCQTTHNKKSDARICESRAIEQKRFLVGDRVTNSKELRVCNVKDQPYRFKGRVVKITGPLPPDEEYWIKWLGGLPDVHVFQYEVAYTCPACKREKGAMYFASELEKIA